MTRLTRTALALIIGLGGWGCGDSQKTGVAGDDTSTVDTAPSPDVDAEDVAAAEDAEDGDGSQAVDTAEDTSEPAEDHSDLLFPSDRVIEVAIDLAPSDFEALRQQRRTLFDIIDAACDGRQVPNPFTWFHATATIDGQTVEDVGVRKKGFLGSVDPVRPALKLKLDKFVAHQDLDDLERVTLNNGHQDASRLRTCLAYSVFRAAGVPTPRCAFAHVTVNGSDLGLYAHVESMKKDFVRRWFPEPLGELYEGNVSDFREGWTGTFDRKYDEDEPRSDIIDRVTAAAAVPDDELIAALEEVVDLDELFIFWAVEVVIGHWDGYTNNRNNFLVYADPRDGRLRFIPWGPDGAFQHPPNAPEEQPTSVFANGILAHRLYATPEGRARYHAALAAVLADAFDEQTLLDEVDRLVSLTAAVRLSSEVEAAGNDLALLRQYIAGRRAELEAELADDPDWPYPPGDRPCLVDHGRVYGGLVTTWGTLLEDNLFATGSASLGFETDFFTGDLPGPGGSKAGPDPDAPGAARMQLALPSEPGVYAVLDVTMPLALFKPGPVDTTAPGVQVLMYRLEPGVSVQLLGYLRGGDIIFGDAMAVDGSDVTATFDLRLMTF